MVVITYTREQINVVLFKNSSGCEDLFGCAKACTWISNKKLKIVFHMIGVCVKKLY